VEPERIRSICAAIFIQAAVQQRLHLNASITHFCPEWTTPTAMPVYKLRMVLRLVLREISGFLRNKPKSGGLAKLLKMKRKEHQGTSRTRLAKAKVAGSRPVSRSKYLVNRYLRLSARPVAVFPR
jgi:hypothetical protein